MKRIIEIKENIRSLRFEPGAAHFVFPYICFCLTHSRICISNNDPLIFPSPFSNLTLLLFFYEQTPARDRTFYERPITWIRKRGRQPIKDFASILNKN